MEQKIPNSVIIEPISKRDYVFGVSTIDTEIKVESGDWTPYLPTEERQKREFESYACTDYSSNNCVELLMNRKIKEGLVAVDNLQWLNDNGYIDENGLFNCSDRFDAIISGTDPNYGNALKAPAEAKHKYGVIPECVFPWVSDKTEYYDKANITDEMYVLGLKFLARFPISYEVVYEKDFVEALKVSPLAGALYAWNGTKNGIYYESGQDINHAIAIIKPKDIWNIFDSYDPFIKRLNNNYNLLSYAYRYIVGEVEPSEIMNNTIVDKALLKKLYNLVFHRDLDEGAEAHIGRDLETLLNAFEESGEFKFWDGIIRFFKALKPSFSKYGKNKK